MAKNYKEMIENNDFQSLTLGDIAKLSKEAKLSGVNRLEKIQFIALAALYHAQNHKDDFSACTNILHDLVNADKKTDLILWFETHAPMELRTVKTKTGASVKVFKKVKDDNANPYNLAQAKNTPYYAMTKAQKEKEAKEIEQFVKTERAAIKAKRKAIEKGEYGSNVTGILAYLQAREDSLKTMAA